MIPRENQRGEYGSRRGDLANLGIVGIGLAIGLASWPAVKRRNPLGFIAMSASGSMVAVGVTKLLFGTL